MRVFLGNGPWRTDCRIGVRAGTRWPFTMPCKKGQRIPEYLPFPFLLAYAASALEEAKHDVLLVDGIAEGLSEDEFIGRAKAFKPQLAVLETSTPSIHIDLEMAKRLKALGCRVALCGPHASAFHQELLKQNGFLDFILIGEYELSLASLASALSAGGKVEGVNGIAFRKGSSVATTKPQQIIQDLDSIPRPAYKFLPMLNYNDAFAGLPKPSVQMWASRGCPFNCSFCLWPRVMYGGRNYRARSPKAVADEMEFLVKTYGFKSVYFDDDTFDIGKERILELCRLIKEKKLNIKWAAMARADTCDEEMLIAMKGARLYAIKFGIESGSQELVDKCGKSLDLRKARSAVALCKRLGIKVHLTFTFGLPGENWESVRKTIAFSHELNPDSIQFSLTTPFPGTPYFEELDSKGFILTKDWQKYDGSLSCVMRTDELSSQDLEKALGMALRSWRVPLFFRSLGNPDFLMRGIRNPVAALRYIANLALGR